MPGPGGLRGALTHQKVNEMEALGGPAEEVYLCSSSSWRISLARFVRRAGSTNMIDVCEIRSIVRSSASTLCSVEASISLTFFDRFCSALSAIWFSWLISDDQSMSGSPGAGGWTGWGAG